MKTRSHVCSHTNMQVRKHVHTQAHTKSQTLMHMHIPKREPVLFRGRTTGCSSEPVLHRTPSVSDPPPGLRSDSQRECRLQLRLPKYYDTAISGRVPAEGYSLMGFPESQKAATVTSWDGPQWPWLGWRVKIYGCRVHANDRF